MDDRDSERATPGDPVERAAGYTYQRPDGMQAAAPDARLPAALLHQLSERLTAAENYLQALRRQVEINPQHACPQLAEILDKALSQLGQGGQIFHHLRQALNGPPLAGDGTDRSYRVCFMNRLDKANKAVTTCQRTIVIHSAASREAAIAAAKKRFTELEGISDWRIHAAMIEAELLKDDAAE